MTIKNHFIKTKSMKTLKFAFMMVIFFLDQKVNAGVEIYGMWDLGSVFYHELNNGSSYSNQSSFFTGHWGYSLGARAKFNLGPLGLGGVSEISWIGDSMDHKISGDSTGSVFRNEFNRNLSGPSVSYDAGPSTFFMEYYPWIQNKVIYSDEKAQNPFRKEDSLTGTGYGIGASVGFPKGIAFQLMYRKIEYKKIRSIISEIELPTDLYSTIKLDELMFGFVLRF